MDPRKKRSQEKTSYSMNLVLSNVNCQDESSITSPLFRSRHTENQKNVISWCDYENAETLPSDWLSDFSKLSKVEDKYSLDSRTQFCSSDIFSKETFLSVIDESSQGSDSGLGNETTTRLKNRHENVNTFNRCESHDSEDRQSVWSSDRLSSFKSVVSENDDGFSEDIPDDMFLKRINSNKENLPFDSPQSCFVGQFERAPKSPFTLHRRNSVSRSPSIKTQNSKLTSQPLVNVRQGKRPSFDGSAVSHDQTETLSTTPKRRKSIGKPFGLRRAMSSHPCLDTGLINQSTKTSAQPYHSRLTPVKNSDTDNPFDIEASQSSLLRSHSEFHDIPRMDEKKVDRMIEAIDNFSLVGNSTSSHLLPTSDRHRFELIHVQAENVASLLTDKRKNDVMMIDCRYPYEYSGGHVTGAINLYTEEQVWDRIIAPALERTKLEENCCFRLDSINPDNCNSSTVDVTHSPLKCAKNHVDQSRVLIFYCEFSSRRAPSLAKFLRGADRKLNLLKYPYLFYPEIYIMAGGYHNFVQTYMNLCEPQGYVKMFDKSFNAELSKYKRKTRKIRVQDHILKRSPTDLRISPLRLLENENRPRSSPPSPPRTIVWS